MHPRPVLLISSFGPFPGVPSNPTGALAARLLPVLDAMGVDGRHVALPTRFDVAWDTLRAALDDAHATGRLIAVVALGVSGQLVMPHLETIAFNHREPGRHDAAGATVEALDTTLVHAAPSTLPTALPVDAILARARTCGAAIGVSADPGRYLCNEVFFKLMAWRGEVGFEGEAGFVHVPQPRDEVHAEATVKALDVVFEAVIDAAGESAAPLQAPPRGPL